MKLILYLFDIIYILVHYTWLMKPHLNDYDMSTCQFFMSNVTGTSYIRAFTIVKLNSYIAILASPKYKNSYYSSGAKGKNFTFIVIVHSYVWLCIVAKS